MSTVSSIWSAFIVMIICGVVGVIAAFAFGLSVDEIHMSFLDANMYNLENTDWDNGYSSTVEPMMGILYIFLYCIPLFGVAVFLLSVFKDRLKRIFR